jgi:ubiquinone/menaquinone biosynthesis C-methylase UbiE
MDERAIEAFWNSHPCGENLLAMRSDDYDLFFRRYDRLRYSMESHILRCLDEADFKGRQVLEIGLGQGADSEQIIRRGGQWSGLELTQESVDRVRTRLTMRGLQSCGIKTGSVLEIPWPDGSFDVVYSHGVLHHVPEVRRAQFEIARVLRPGGRLIAMLYAKHSLNYWFAISLVRRVALAACYGAHIRSEGVVGEHLRNARQVGLWKYLRMQNFIHRNTDGPHNPYSKVYSRTDIDADFPSFVLERAHKEFMHAPPLPVHGWPGARSLGWHLWAHLRRR